MRGKHGLNGGLLLAMALGLAACGQPGGTASAPPPPVKWEYKTLTLVKRIVTPVEHPSGDPLKRTYKSVGKTYEQLLNEAGQEGWELVTIVDTGSGLGGTVAYFKRPLKPGPSPEPPATP